MSEKFTKWDAAKYLKTEEDIALYLDAVIEESDGNSAAIAKALGDFAVLRVKLQRQVSSKHDWRVTLTLNVRIRN